MNNRRSECGLTPIVAFAEADWRAARTQSLLEAGADRYEALAQVCEEAKTKPWNATKTIATSAYTVSVSGQFQGKT